MSVGWVTLWVRPSPVKICVSVRWVTLWVRPPLCENMCVRSLGYIVDASPPLCVRSIGNTVGASPPHVCPFVGSLHDAFSALRHFFITHEQYDGDHAQQLQFNYHQVTPNMRSPLYTLALVTILKVRLG